MTDDSHREWVDSWNMTFSETVLTQMNRRLVKTGMYVTFDVGELLDPSKYARFKGDVNKNIV